MLSLDLSIPPPPKTSIGSSQRVFSPFLSILPQGPLLSPVCSIVNLRPDPYQEEARG